jgi:hypothetical protein
MFVLCVMIKTNGKMQDNQDTETSTHEVQKEYTRTQKKKNPGAGEIFRTRPDQAWGPPSRDVALTRHSYLGPRLKKSTPTPPLPLWAFTVCSRDSLTINKGCSQ